MEKIALVCDSGCDLKQDAINEYNIHVLPLRIIYKDREFLDRVTITPQEIYANIETEIPTTSLPSIKDMDELFSKLKNENFTHILCICLSSGLSGTFNALSMVAQNYKDMNIHIFDSKILTMSTGSFVIRCGNLIKEGFSFDEIIKTLPTMRKNTALYFVVGTLEYLKKGGRIGKVAGTIGELLNIKPIISVNDDGIYYTHAKARGKKQALTLMLDLIKEKTSNNKCRISIVHGDAEEEALKIMEKIKEMPNVISIYFSEISPALFVHTGPGAIGISIEKED